MNKGTRQELKRLKYKNRLRYWVSVWKRHTLRDGTEIVSPTVQDLIGDKAYLHLKTQAMMCSCGMCSYLKYERKDFRKETQEMIQEGLEDFYNE